MGAVGRRNGVFVFPGVGALLAAGPIVEALGGAIAGATLTGGAMAGAAALTELASALHRIGVPETELATIHGDIEKGRFIVILHCSPDLSEKYTIQLRWAGADTIVEIPIEH